jgi:hypothetical protein
MQEPDTLPIFDPYHRWLGISRERRPPTHYQLLGIASQETDAEVIKEAALRQTTHVRVYQTGPHAELCTRLLNEIAQARAVLLNPQMRQEYDEGLAKPSQPSVPEPAATRITPAYPFRPVTLLAAAAYFMLVLVGFAASFCLTYQSLRTAVDAAARALPAGEREP